MALEEQFPMLRSDALEVAKEEVGVSSKAVKERRKPEQEKEKSKPNLNTISYEVCNSMYVGQVTILPRHVRMLVFIQRRCPEWCV
jgi:hypothetical protein